MFNYKDYKFLLCCGAVDMRKSINGLSDIVCSQFNLDPRDKVVFVFCNNSRNRIKLLVWEDNGFWIHFKTKFIKLGNKSAAILEPLYLELKKQMLQEELLHADETTLEVLNEPGRNTTSKSYVWVYRTSAYASTPVIMYEYTVGRSGSFAKEFLKDWKGKFLHCDGYAGYKKLEGITMCGCLVHAKRKRNVYR